MNAGPGCTLLSLRAKDRPFVSPQQPQEAAAEDFGLILTLFQNPLGGGTRSSRSYHVGCRVLFVMKEGVLFLDNV
jgi:hypothetical protein